ncbi:MAG: hypothetical protein EPO21_11440 [Chloroflexota bacterium]|nr:MAG: hypothetical protein EPO21_11440 [Chloroflexota bacterium]
MSSACIEVRELLSPYIDDQVTPTERSTVETHLRGCSACARELDTLRETTALLRRVPQVTVPRSFTLEAPRRQPSALFAFLRAGSALATAVFLVLLTLDVVTSGVLPVGGGFLSSAPIASEANRPSPPAPQAVTRKEAASKADDGPAAAPSLRSAQQEQLGAGQAASAAAPQAQELSPVAPAAAPQPQGAPPLQSDSALSRPNTQPMAPFGSPTSPAPEPATSGDSAASSGPTQPEQALRLVEAAALGLALATGIGALWFRRNTTPTSSRRSQRS